MSSKKPNLYLVDVNYDPEIHDDKKLLGDLIIEWGEIISGLLILRQTIKNKSLSRKERLLAKFEFNALTARQKELNKLSDAIYAGKDYLLD